jgi:hypothetical protein
MNAESEQAQEGLVGARGWLKNGNRPGDFHDCARCGAKTRTGQSCKSPAMKNGRCRMHGGRSTGPRTQDGLLRSGRAHRKHGRYSKIRIEYARMLSQLTKCVSLSTELVDIQLNWLCTSDSAEIEKLRARMNSALQKGARILGRIWANQKLRSFAEKVPALRQAYLQCQLTPAEAVSSAEQDRYPFEGGGRPALTIWLLRECSVGLPYALFGINPLAEPTEGLSTLDIEGLLKLGSGTSTYQPPAQLDHPHPVGTHQTEQTVEGQMSFSFG